MPLSSKPVGPTGPAHPHALPTGTFPARDTLGYFGDLTGDAPSTQPVEPSMPLRPRLAPGTPMQAMTVPSDPTGAGKHPFVVILSKQQATDIYMMRSPDTTTDEFKDVAGKSSMVAEMYRVSPKTIRDIWNRKTWTQVTRASWSAEEAEEHAQEQALAKLPPAERAALKDELKKRRGRPPGSKDTRPRRRRLKAGEKGEPSEGVMYVTTDEGAVEVRPIPAAPCTSDALDRSSPVRQAPPFNAQRVIGLKAQHDFESGKSSAEAKASRSQTFDSSAPTAAPVAPRFSGARSHSFDACDAAMPDFIPRAKSSPHSAALCGISKDSESSSAYSSPHSSEPGAPSRWCDEEPGASEEDTSCASEPGAASSPEQESSGSFNDEDPEQQNILGPIDDQLDLFTTTHAVFRAPPAAPAWVPTEKQETRTGLTLEQEFEFRKQRHQAEFAESRSMLNWISQHHSNPYPACGGAPRFLSAATASVKPESPIVSSMSSTPAVAGFAEEPGVQGSGPSHGEEGGSSSMVNMVMGAGEVHHGCDHHGLWFPGSSEQQAHHQQHAQGGGPAGDHHGLESGEWHAPFFSVSRECSRDVSGIDKQLALPSAGSSPCISHVLARSGMSGLQSVAEDGWWGAPAVTSMGSWRSDSGLRPV
mmetsp:Transcript_38222/g.93027  ORF Transcript_38222/g.93027 Transcript_38222/m.93027 type:complete len:644 (-) Transcript_38222:257-2188(-)